MEKKGLSLTLNKKPTKVVANKRTMNFAYHESAINWKKLGIILGIVAVIAALFVKFAIIDQLAIKKDAQNRLQASQERLAQVNETMKSYDKLKAEYDRYSDARLNANELFLLSRVDILDIVRNHIVPECVVRSFNVRDNTISLSISNLSLADASELVFDLEEHELVTDVHVSYAESPDSDLAAMTIEIEVQKGAESDENA